MKKLLLLFTSILFLFAPILSFWFSEDALYENSKPTVQKAQLIHSYIQWLKKQILLFQEQYNIGENNLLWKELHSLDTMIKILQSMEKSPSNENEKNIKIILDELKKSKKNITTILKQSKDTYEKSLQKKKKAYISIWKKLNQQLSGIILKIYKIIQQKDIDKNGIEVFWENEKLIIQSLKNLHEESKKLSHFENKVFVKENNMKEYFIQILKNIKQEMLTINKIWLY